jgi:hypothetical protein
MNVRLLLVVGGILALAVSASLTPANAGEQYGAEIPPLASQHRGLFVFASSDALSTGFTLQAGSIL